MILRVVHAFSLGKASHGDDIDPADMTAFAVPEGKGVYIHPGVWHNGICEYLPCPAWMYFQEYWTRTF